MGKLFIHIACDQDGLFDEDALIERLKDPKWNYSNLRQYLSIFTGEEIVWVDHLFQCFRENEPVRILLAWVILKDHSERLYCIAIDEPEEKQ